MEKRVGDQAAFWPARRVAGLVQLSHQVVDHVDGITVVIGSDEVLDLGRLAKAAIQARLDQHDADDLQRARKPDHEAADRLSRAVRALHPLQGTVDRRDRGAVEFQVPDVEDAAVLGLVAPLPGVGFGMAVVDLALKTEVVEPGRAPVVSQFEFDQPLSESFFPRGKSRLF